MILPVGNTTSQTLDADWKLSKNKKGIAIYTRKTKKSNLKMFKVITEFDESIEHIVEVLQDVDNYNKWSENLKYSRLLEKIDTNTIIIYSVLDMPWPFDNRDVVNKSTTYWSASKDTAIITIRCLQDYLPEKKGIIRIPHADGSWKLYKIDDQHFKVEYTFMADPGGSIPGWVVNIFIVDGPYKTVNNLKDYLKVKYKDN